MLVPLVSIIGRPNVGKSTLFNRIIGRRLAIVGPTPGTTRDRVSYYIRKKGYLFELADTGGIIGESSDEMIKEVEAKVIETVRKSIVVIFVLDGNEDLNSADKKIASLIRKNAQGKIILVANKCEGKKHIDNLIEFESLGFGKPLDISALQNINVDEIITLTESYIEQNVELIPPADLALKIAVTGKRNTGKSTFINALINEERCIVSEIPGTTRDTVNVLAEIDEKSILLLDTAGMKKKKKFESRVNYYSNARSEKAIRFCDLTLFFLDATQEISRADMKILNLLESYYKPYIIVLNKWDIVNNQDVGAFEDYLNIKLKRFNYAPACIISAKEKFNLDNLLRLCFEIYDQGGTLLKTSFLNSVFKGIRKRRAPYGQGGGIPKIYYVVQTSVHPPTIRVYINKKKLFTEEYLRFIKNRLKEDLPFKEIPFKLEFIEKEPRELLSNRNH